MSNHGQAYLREANRQFLRDSGFNAPVEAVEAGVKTIAQWCELLTAIRNAYNLNVSSLKPTNQVQQFAQLEQHEC